MSVGLGFSGKAAIHPSQIAVIHEAFRPKKGRAEGGADRPRSPGGGGTGTGRGGRGRPHGGRPRGGPGAKNPGTRPPRGNRWRLNEDRNCEEQHRQGGTGPRSRPRRIRPLRGLCPAGRGLRMDTPALPQEGGRPVHGQGRRSLEEAIRRSGLEERDDHLLPSSHAERGFPGLHGSLPAGKNGHPEHHPRPQFPGDCHDCVADMVRKAWSPG